MRTWYENVGTLWNTLADGFLVAVYDRRHRNNRNAAKWSDLLPPHQRDQNAETRRRDLLKLLVGNRDFNRTFTNPALSQRMSGGRPPDVPFGIERSTTTHIPGASTNIDGKQVPPGTKVFVTTWQLTAIRRTIEILMTLYQSAGCLRKMLTGCTLATRRLVSRHFQRGPGLVWERSEFIPNLFIVDLC